MEDTIYSLATPPGRGAIAIVRISGESAKTSLEAIFKGRIQDHYLSYGRLEYRGKAIDSCLAVFMESPRTYTREDVAELHIHGGSAVVAEVMDVLSQLGLRQAQAGEFTKRAFLNGRIDLSQAEAVMDMVNASTSAAKSVAMAQMEGESKNFINSHRESILDILAKIGVAIDYPEEDIETETMDEVKAELQQLASSLEQGISTRLAGEILSGGYKIAVVGRPNVGKSSLVNAILGKDRVIVTDIAGTTRDTLSESYSYKGYLFTLLDTAGIRDSDDVIEKMGIEKSRQAIEQANIVLAVFDGSQPLTREDEDILSLTDGRSRLVVVNKCDLPKRADIHGILISAKGLKNIDTLLEKVYSEMSKDMGELGILTASRHISLAKKAVASFNEAICAIENCEPPECVEIHIRDGWHNLCEITGEALDEDIISRIFEKFCLGK